MPTRPWIPRVSGVALLLPAGVGYFVFGPESFLIAAAVFGVLLFAVSFLPKRPATEATKSKLRVFQASTSGGQTLLAPPTPPAPTLSDRACLRGRVRSASSFVLTSPLEGEECVVFGVLGDVDGYPIEDADGGDFDLEVAMDDRVLVSLEHAVFLVDDEDPNAPSSVELTPDMESFLESRGIGGGRAPCILAEHLIREGDEVTCEGVLSGGVLPSLASRGPNRVRIVAGTADAPLRIRKVALA